MTNVGGMVSRGTKSAGVQGPERAISRQAALELYTAASARLDREGERRGGHHHPGAALAGSQVSSGNSGRSGRVVAVTVGAWIPPYLQSPVSTTKPTWST
jgi:hypothetical protein